MEATSPYRPPREVVPGGGREERDVLTDALADELLGAALIAKLATFNADGSIHLVPMWFAWEPPALLIPTSGRTRKCRNLARDPRATVMIDDSRGGLDLRGVTLVGEAEIVGGADVPAVNRAIHLRYLTEAGRALQEVDAYLRTDDVTVRFVPRRISSWDLRSTAQCRAIAAAGAARPLYGSAPSEAKGA
jgi:PPOX class probable F420-dependent enzyme